MKRSERAKQTLESDKLMKKLMKAIRIEVSWFNGWHANESALNDSIRKAAIAALRVMAKADN